MAKLLAYYNLCPINNIDDFLGLSPDVDPGCVINTLGRNIILVVKLSNQRQIRSWTVLDRLSSKVVYDFKSEKYVAVFGGRYLRCWSQNQGDLNAVKKIKLYRTVQDLFSLAGGQTLLLYTDGSCESLEHALDTRSQSKQNHTGADGSSANVDPKSQTIQDVKVLVLDNGSPLLTYFIRNEEDGSVEFNYALLNTTDLKPLKSYEKIKMERIGEDYKLASSCIVDGSDGPSLMSIWSDNRIFNLQLSLGHSPKRDEGVGNFIEMVQNINVTQPLSMACIGKDYVAVYANNTSQDGAMLVLFNVQFKVFQAKQLFKVYFRVSRFWVVESNILLAFGQMLAVVPFKISKEQLSDMIGSQRTFDLSHTIDDESINEECEFIDTFAFDRLLAAIDEQPKVVAENGVEEEQEDPLYDRVESERAFEDMLRVAYHETLPVSVIESDALPEDMVQIKLFNNADLSLGPLVLTETFEIMLEELEHSGYSEMDICDKIVPWLIQSNLPEDLGKCLKRYSVVSERTIIRALKYAMSRRETHQEEAMESDETPVANGSSDVPEKSDTELPNQDIIVTAQADHPSHRDLLNVVLSCSFNKAALIPHARTELDLSTVMDLLRHLEYLLVDPMATLSETLHSGGDKFDSDEQTVQWVAVLLDSHYQQLIMSTESTIREQLQRILDVVDRHVRLAKQLQDVASSLRHVMQRKTQQTPGNQWYSVESITLY